MPVRENMRKPRRSLGKPCPLHRTPYVGTRIWPTTLLRCSSSMERDRSSTKRRRENLIAITELAESQASDRTVMSIAGHVSQRMLAHYSHVRIEAKRKALDSLATGGKANGYDTSSETKPKSD